MLLFKGIRQSPALKPLGELTPSERRIVRLLGRAQAAAGREVDAALPQVADALSRGATDTLLGLLPVEPWLDAQEPLADELLGELLDAGSRVKLPTLQKATLVFEFDRARPEAARWARNEAGSMITEITRNQRQVVREIVARAQRGSVDWFAVARRVRATIGLTSAQADWVTNHYERAFADGVARGLSVEQAAERASRSAARYQETVHRYRAETIARTETMRANSQGRMLAWDQGLEQGFIRPDWKKEWIAEANACPICLAVDGVQVPVKSDFPIGEPPAHPNCRCDVLLIPDAV